MNQGSQTSFHIFFYIHLLLINRFDLNEFVFVLEVKKERVPDEVKILIFIDVNLNLFDRLEKICEEGATELL